MMKLCDIKDMKKALWFSRHSPVPEQITDALTMGFVLETQEQATNLACLSLETDAHVIQIVAYLQYVTSWTVKDNYDAVFGVFAVPLQKHLTEGFAQSLFCCDFVPCYAAWNINRTIEGQKTAFIHKIFIQVGAI